MPLHRSLHGRDLIFVVKQKPANNEGKCHALGRKAYAELRFLRKFIEEEATMSVMDVAVRTAEMFIWCICKLSPCCKKMGNLKLFSIAGVMQRHNNHVDDSGIV